MLIDSGAAAKSTDEIGQFKALQRVDDLVHLDVSIAKLVSFTFGIGSTVSLESINFITFLRSITFYIVSINTSFLLCLVDMDRLRMFFNNVTNQLIQSNQVHFVIRRYGHAFLRWHIFTYFFVSESLNMNLYYLTEIELRRLHRRFGHFSVRRLEMILDRIDYDFDTRVFRHLTKYCD